MKVLAPSKINLYLHISGKRPDGYHELETLMCPLSLADEIEIELADQGVALTIEGADLPSGPENLAYRAADEFFKMAQVDSAQGGARIHLKKRIPTGGGLAGGSSNAAAVLLALNQLLGEPLSMDQLGSIAAGMGSDINFFLQHEPAICSGRGEKVCPHPLRNLPWALLINPGFGVSTPWAYKTYAQNPAQGEVGRTFEWGAGAPPDSVVTLRNDLEPAVFSKYIWIAETKAWLQRQPMVLDALMSGSGATVFALVEDEKAAAKLTAQARDYLGHATWIQAVRLGSHRS